MEPLKLLSLGAIALALSACIVVYILHKRTTARLDALTQANMGITQTLHQLVASTMPRPRSQLQAQTQSQTELVPTETRNISDVTQVGEQSGNVKTMDGTGRIVVSDDENSSSYSGGSTTSSEDEVSDNWVDNDNDSDSDSGDESDSEVESASEEIDGVKGQDNTNRTDATAVRVEELSDYKETGENDQVDSDDDSEGDESDDESDIDDDSGSESDSDESDDGQGKIALSGGDVAIESDSLDELPLQETQTVNDVTGDNVDLVAFLLPQKDDKSIDIGIMPVSSNQKGLVPYESSKTLPDGFKQMKVEELRKLIVSKLGMTDDEAKKLKKPQLIQKLSESHE